MKVTMIGTGYVGLVTGACFAEVGNDVLCVDVDARKIAILNEGGVPIHEPGLEAMVHRNVASGRLRFTTDVDASVAHGMLQFIAVGTPPDEDGSADMQYVIQAARSIGRLMQGPKIVVDKSTVPVGTADRVRAAIAEELSNRGVDFAFSVASNPEFLKEGAAVEDFMRPDRVVVGASDERAIAALRAIYAPFRTGGIAGKRSGRVGDSPVLGAGTYADDRSGAGSATGYGEGILRVALTARALEAMRLGAGPEHAAREGIKILKVAAVFDDPSAMVRLLDSVAPKP